MWVNKALFDRMLTDNQRLQDEANYERVGASRMSASVMELRTQKAKDDLTIDWMRHRVNELSKHNALLLAKVAGINVPVPEIVPTRPGSLTLPPDFPTMPSFEDVGDEEALRLGIRHDEIGTVEYATK